MTLQIKVFVSLVACLSLSNLISAQPHRQHPLVGSWEMISVKGTGADGERFFRDTTVVRELKVITPTHYMLIAEDVENGKLIFNRTYAGTFHVNGNNFVEEPIYSSIPIFNNVTEDFSWRREGDRFIQSGTFVRPDGKKIVLDELVFKKFEGKGYERNAAIGVWDEVTVDKGNKDNNGIGFLIITPTHWMNLNYSGNKFFNALGGTYIVKGKRSTLSVDHSSDPLLITRKITQSMKGDQLILKVVEGKKATTRVFKRIPIK